MKIDWIGWSDSGTVKYLDQTLLPNQEVFREARTVEDMIEAIKALRVRGAPLIGISAAMGMAAAAAAQESLTREWVSQAVAQLGDARPTAVNLVWALERMKKVAFSAFDSGDPVVEAIRAEAQSIWDEDTAMCRAIGKHGADHMLDQTFS